MREDFSFKNSIRNWGLLIGSASTKMKIVIAVLAIIVVGIPLMLLFLAIDQPISNPDIKTSSLFSGETLQNNIQYRLILTANCIADASALGETLSLASQPTGLSSYTDAADLISKCIDLAKTTTDKATETTLLIPMGAVGTTFENIAVYHWVTAYETRLTHRSSEVQRYILILNQDLIEVKIILGPGLSITNEISTYRILSLE